jgi:hypothetical protein
MKTLLLAVALLAAVPAFAQTNSQPAYDFLTVLEIESPYPIPASSISFVPTSQGLTQIKLEQLPGNPYSDKYLPAYLRNLEIVNRQLSNLTASGWELVHASNTTAATGVEKIAGHEYIFRRLKK